MAKIDYNKIFITGACPTTIGGQAVMEGVMMQGPDRVALAMRLPSGELYLKTKLKKKQSLKGTISINEDNTYKAFNSYTKSIFTTPKVQLKLHCV